MQEMTLQKLANMTITLVVIGFVIYGIYVFIDKLRTGKKVVKIIKDMKNNNK